MRARHFYKPIVELLEERNAPGQTGGWARS
jgi:hypothetical protein